jgi:transposase
MDKIFKHSAGIDIGSEKVYVSVEDNKEVKIFKTFTTDLILAVKYLKENQIDTVAMEATGVYWVILYDLLEKAGIEPYLVNPKETKQVPGRKSDIQDCQWIQQLHSYGLLRKSFIPDEKIRVLRTYIRHREKLIENESSFINRMQKSLILMNIRLHTVISQIHGYSGLNIIQAILQGERNPKKLVQLCHTSILKNKREDVIKSLEGTYKDEHLFTLKQAYDSFCFTRQQIDECDQEIEKALNEINRYKQPPDAISAGKPIRHHKPNVEDLHKKLLTATEGKDPSYLPGITDYNMMQLISEIGTDLSKWPSKKHFTSWLKLSPGKNQSGKINKRSKNHQTTRAGQIFREAAQTLLRSKNIALGSFARKLRSRKGPAVAIKATARKLAELYYLIMTEGAEYVETGIKQYEQLIIEKRISNLQKQAYRLNFKLTEIE